tara:strand:+ start:7457 stop:7885 length:429 start_codon:yes stop_codon:yes gene_type:complete
MTNPQNRDESGPSSLKQQARDSLRALIDYGQIRVQLAILETREASRLLADQAVFIAVGAGFLFTGYMLSIAALVNLIADRFGTKWEYVGLAIAAFHVVAGCILIIVARTVRNKPIFEATLQELEKDEKWLAQNLPSKKKRER